MTNYRRGVRAELRAIKDLEALGYLCTRSGGSLGLFDVVALGPDGAIFIQVKSGIRFSALIASVRKAQSGIVLALLRRFPTIPDAGLKYEVWAWHQRNGWSKWRLTNGKWSVVPF